MTANYSGSKRNTPWISAPTAGPGGPVVGPSALGRSLTCPRFRRKLPSTSISPARAQGVGLHTPSATGRRGVGQQRYGHQPDQPDCHAAGRSDCPLAPSWYLGTVHGLRLSVGTIVSAIHRTGAGPTGSGRDPGTHPRQPGGSRRRNGLAAGWQQRLRVDLQNSHAATSCGVVGAKQSWTRR